MVLLILFAFVAGAATALSPCVLPILPVVLAGGVTGGRRRPFGIATGLVASFTFATVALIYLLDALGLPDDFARNLAIVGLVVFGLTLLVPAVSDRLEGMLSRLTSRIRVRTGGEGFGSGLGLGLILGVVYAPCAGPILAAVATASASRPFSIDKLLVALAYGIGSGLVIYALMLGGRKLAERLRPVQAQVNVVMGALMIAFALVIATNLDLKFQDFLASDNTPSFIATPTKGLEDSGAIQDDLAKISGRDDSPSPIAQAPAGAQQVGVEPAGGGLVGVKSSLPVLGIAPDFQKTGEWFNSDPLSLADLRGKVVLIDFWTYTCINCIRTLPHVEAWAEKYRKDGLVVVGVHTPEFPFEREASNVKDAIGEYGITYPVVQDNDYGTWDAWGNRYWPAEYLIDAQGRVRETHFGEGNYGKSEEAIRSLLAERGVTKLGGRTKAKAPVPSLAVTTPESYLGTARAANFVTVPLQVGTHSFTTPASMPPNSLAYGGTWHLTQEDATSVKDSTVDLEFGARRVYLVLGSDGGPKPVQVLLDGKPISNDLAGADVKDGAVTVNRQKLYSLVDLPKVERGRLSLEFAPGVSGYAFTFG